MRSQHALLTAAIAMAGCTAEDPMAEADLADEPAEVGRRWITIGADALDTVQAALANGATGAGVRPVEIGGGAALLEVDARDLRLLSEAMHEHHRRCGGFVMHDGIEEGRASLVASARSAVTAAAPAAFAPSYTLDSAATVNALMPALTEAGILSMIQQLSANPTRFHNSASGIAVSSWLRDRWAGYAVGRSDVQVTLFAHTETPQPSVIATIPGTTRASEVIVIGGHLDSVSSTGAAPGADDDASGIATLSEVLRVLIAKNYRPERTLKFIAYAAEEVGLVGSKAIAADARAKGTNVVGVLQLDMTNYKGSPQDIYLITDFTNAAQNAFVGSLITTYVGATYSTDVCGYGCSDHASWHREGYPASMPAEARFSDINPMIHTAGDTLGVSGNSAAHALKFARLATAFAAELGEGAVGGPQNAAPAVSISSPAANGTFPRAVQLAGTAIDPEDGTISDRLAWASSVDGALGTGATRDVKLSAGVHTITATAQDSGGATGTASASV
ncbi:MAG TPA: M20/M25/M40 family metallo-hydrolase, partial [Kofleriaceae bacterium]|nr:M20/M25/M40 family metallo-hydrolase [Kofleriaceae bacterium]